MYIAVTTRGYNTRFVYSSPDGASRGVLGVLKKEILERFADVSLTAGPNGLSAKAGPILKSLCDEFNDLKSLDKMAGVQAKVDAVTGVMQSNISLALRNTDRIEDIDEKATNLADSAQKFKSSSTQLKNAERCKLIKCVRLAGGRGERAVRLPQGSSLNHSLPFFPFPFPAGAMPWWWRWLPPCWELLLGLRCKTTKKIENTHFGFWRKLGNPREGECLGLAGEKAKRGPAAGTLCFGGYGALGQRGGPFKPSLRRAGRR